MTTDPRKIPGGIAGPGGPHDRGGVVIDTRHAVLLETVDVSTLDEANAIAMSLGGRINRSKDRANVLFLFGTDGAAAIVTELIALMGRATGSPEPFVNDLKTRLDKLTSEGNMA